MCFTLKGLADEPQRKKESPQQCPRFNISKYFQTGLRCGDVANAECSLHGSVWAMFIKFARLGSIGFLGFAVSFGTVRRFRVSLDPLQLKGCCLPGVVELYWKRGAPFSLLSAKSFGVQLIRGCKTEIC